LNADAQQLLIKLGNSLRAGGYSERTVRNYSSEVRFLFSYFNDLDPLSIGQDEIVLYINYLKSGLNLGRAKCRIAAQSFSFFYKHVLRKPYSLPSKLFPRKDYTLPEILSQSQAVHLFQCIPNIKHRCMIALLYGAGLRLNELRMLKIKCIDSNAMQIKVVQGKGNKDRFTILPKFILEDLRKYFRQNRPKEYLFEGYIPDRPMHERAIGHMVTQCMKLAGLEGRSFSAHTLRHSFATHLLDQGVDIHSIKELLGHTKLETTMIYLHLQQSKRATLVSPLDTIMKPVIKPEATCV
jgi:site-specific recombinase XerD